MGQRMSRRVCDVTAGGVILFGRLNSGLDALLQKACSEVNLSRRAIQALLLMSSDDTSETVSNQWLQQKFVEHKLSSSLSAGKDSSIAKSDLLVRGLIEIRGRVSEFGVTELGRSTASQLVAVMQSTIDEMELSELESFLLRELMSAGGNVSSNRSHQPPGLHVVSSKTAG
jgi:hypothetical protein